MQNCVACGCPAGGLDLCEWCYSAALQDEQQKRAYEEMLNEQMQADYERDMEQIVAKREIG